VVCVTARAGCGGSGPGERTGRPRESGSTRPEDDSGDRGQSTEDVPRLLASGGAWAKALYQVKRSGVDYVKATVSWGKSPGRNFDVPVPGGNFYLAIGLFIYFRRASATQARHFYVFCLASFIYCCFHYTVSSMLRPGDLLGNMIAAAGAGAAASLHHDVPRTAHWYRK